MKKGLSLEDSSLTNGTIAFTGKRTEGWLATLSAMPSAAKMEAPLKHRAAPRQTRNLLDLLHLDFTAWRKFQCNLFLRRSYIS